MAAVTAIFRGRINFSRKPLQRIVIVFVVVFDFSALVLEGEHVKSCSAFQTIVMA